MRIVDCAGNTTIASIEKVDEEPFIQKWGGDFPAIQKILIYYLVFFDSDKAKEIQSFIQELRNKRKLQNDNDTDIENNDINIDIDINDDDTIFDDFPF